MSSPVLYGRLARTVSSSFVARDFSSHPREYAFVATGCSPVCFVSQVVKTTRSSLYLRTHYSDGSHVDTRIDIRKYPLIYVLDPLPLVFYND